MDFFLKKWIFLGKNGFFLEKMDFSWKKWIFLTKHGLENLKFLENTDLS
jgi:hypothetical protein